MWEWYFILCAHFSIYLPNHLFIVWKQSIFSLSSQKINLAANEIHSMVYSTWLNQFLIPTCHAKINNSLKEMKNSQASSNLINTQDVCWSMSVSRTSVFDTCCNVGSLETTTTTTKCGHPSIQQREEALCSVWLQEDDDQDALLPRQGRRKLIVQ